MLRTPALSREPIPEAQHRLLTWSWIHHNKMFFILGLCTIILHLRSKVISYGKIWESNPFWFLTTRQYQGRGSSTSLHKQAAEQTDTLVWRRGVPLTYVHTCSSAESFLTYYRMCLSVGSHIFSIYFCDTDFMSHWALWKQQPCGSTEVFPIFLPIRNSVWEIVTNRYFLPLIPAVWVLLQINNLQATKLGLYTILQIAIIIIIIL